MAMQAIDEYEYDRTLILPPADVYAVNDLLEWLTISSVNCDHPRGTPIGILTKFRQPARNDEKGNCAPAAQNANARPCCEPDATDQEVGSASGKGIGRSAIGHPILASAVKVGDMLLAFESSDRICDQCQIAIEEYRDYLLRRLHEAVILGEFELWDILRRQVLAPPENEDGVDTPTPEASNSEPSRPLLQKMRSQPAQSLKEFSFIHALHKPIKTQQATLSPQRRYKTIAWWATMAYIYKRDLVSFCMGERVRILFEDEVAEMEEKREESSAIAARTDELKPVEGTADYKRLAEIFDVEPNADQNLRWFKYQCSNNLNRNKLFRLALEKEGRPGGQPAQFSVIRIAAALMDRNKARPRISYRNHLRRRIEKFVPELIHEFDAQFDDGV